jgi:hypothetical protein
MGNFTLFILYINLFYERKHLVFPAEARFKIWWVKEENSETWIFNVLFDIVLSTFVLNRLEIGS